MWVGFPQKTEQLEERSQPALHPLDKSDHRNLPVLQGQDKALLTLPELPSASGWLLQPEFLEVQQSHPTPEENKEKLPWDGAKGWNPPRLGSADLQGSARVRRVLGTAQTAPGLWFQQGWPLWAGPVRTPWCCVCSPCAALPLTRLLIQANWRCSPCSGQRQQTNTKRDLGAGLCWPAHAEPSGMWQIRINPSSSWSTLLSCSCTGKGEYLGLQSFPLLLQQINLRRASKRWHKSARQGFSSNSFQCCITT